MDFTDWLEYEKLGLNYLKDPFGVIDKGDDHAKE